MEACRKKASSLHTLLFGLNARVSATRVQGSQNQESLGAFKADILIGYMFQTSCGPAEFQGAFSVRSPGGSNKTLGFADAPSSTGRACAA